jgi:DNA-binding beta-propeller fold protein YncE
MKARLPTALALAALSMSCRPARPPASPPPASAAATVRSIALPGAPASGGVAMDYIAYDRAHRRVWVPAGNTGSVDVIDVTTGKVSRIEGFPTSEVERRGRKRTLGPSSATVGDSAVYVGNRGDNTVCALDAESFQKGACVKLAAMPDAVAFVASTKEVWVTTPSEKAIVVLEASAPQTLTVKTRIVLEGQPEGFTVDDSRGVFFTNLEDKDRTLTIDLKTHQVSADWPSACGDGGPKGLALDRALDLLFVACSDRVEVMDVGHGGKELSRIETGAGVDDIAYLESRRQLYVGAARAAKLTVASIDGHGSLKLVEAVATAAGARNAVVTEQGVAYLTDAPEGKLLVVSPSGPP